jgi:hypothetical protein
MLRFRHLSVAGLAALALCPAAARPAQAQVLAPNLLYTSVQPCRLFDTRFATNGINGRLVHGVTQTFNIVGNSGGSYFTGQGGNSGGCGIPGFGNGGTTPQVQAVVLNFVAVGSAGGGDLVAWPTDQSQPGSSILNYANSANLGFLNIANAIVLPVRQNMEGGDISVKAQASDTDVLADVVGYFSSSSPTAASSITSIFLGPKAGNPAASTGVSNTVMGYFALGNNATGSNNAVFGRVALPGSTSGGSNAAFGDSSLYTNQTGSSNTAIGTSALMDNTTGSGNIAVGSGAGAHITAGTFNIDIGGSPASDESNVIRIGAVGTQTAAFIAGVNGVTSSGGTAVFVNSSGQLGTATSSLRFKEDVEDMGTASDALLQLRPVTFHYKPAYDDGSRLLQYGLIAEEVARVYPGLVQYDQEGRPLTVRYQFVPAMLLNEVQKQRARIEELEARLARLEAAAGNRR